MKTVFSQVITIVVSLLMIGWSVHLIFKDHESFLQDASRKSASAEAIVIMSLMSCCMFVLYHFHPNIHFMPLPAQLTRNGIKNQSDVFNYLRSAVYVGFLACLAHLSYVLLVSEIQDSCYKDAYHVILLVAFTELWSVAVYVILAIRSPIQIHKLVQKNSDGLKQLDLKPSESFVISLGPPPALPLCKY